MLIKASTWPVDGRSGFSEDIDPLRMKLMHEPLNILMLLHRSSEGGRWLEGGGIGIVVTVEKGVLEEALVVDILNTLNQCSRACSTRFRERPVLTREKSPDMRTRR